MKHLYAVLILVSMTIVSYADRYGTNGNTYLGITLGKSFKYNNIDSNTIYIEDTDSYKNKKTGELLYYVSSWNFNKYIYKPLRYIDYRDDEYENKAYGILGNNSMFAKPDLTEEVSISKYLNMLRLIYQDKDGEIGIVALSGVVTEQKRKNIINTLNKKYILISEKSYIDTNRISSIGTIENNPRSGKVILKIYSHNGNIIKFFSQNDSFATEKNITITYIRKKIIELIEAKELENKKEKKIFEKSEVKKLDTL